MPHPPTDEREAPRTQSETDNSEAERTCPECTGALVRDDDSGETVCGACGLVVHERTIDRGPEWRAYTPEEDQAKRRVGSPTTDLMHDKGLSTTIDWRNTDATGRTLNPRKQATIHRLRKWDQRFRTKSSNERNLQQALGEIIRMASALGLPTTTQETASVIYRRALDEDLLPGRSIEGVATAALYAAARQADTPRTLDEMTEVSRIDRLELSRTYRYLNRELALDIQPADPVQYLPRFSSDLGIADETEHRARELLNAAKAESIASGKSPVSLAAAAIYAAGLLTEESLTQSAVSEITDVSEVTIRNRYTDLFDIADPGHLAT